MSANGNYMQNQITNFFVMDNDIKIPSLSVINRDFKPGDTYIQNDVSYTVWFTTDLYMSFMWVRNVYMMTKPPF